MQLSRKSAQRGQGMTEYVIVVALVGIAAIAVYQLFGSTVRSQTAGIAKELAGQDAESAITNAGNAATKAVTEGSSNRSLASYNDNANRGDPGGAGGAAAPSGGGGGN
jgi:type II secretory pathway pseudopilin PulG